MFSSWEKGEYEPWNVSVDGQLFRFWYAFGFPNYSQLEDGGCERRL